jgi:predicted nucleic acid-binding protein
MKYLFDSSAIFKTIEKNQIEVLSGNLTLDLARYELGNIVWKDSVLQARISEKDAKNIVKVFGRTLSVMDVLDIAGSEEEILETAIGFKITFYDAAYVYFSKTRGVRLVTEDLRLIKKISQTVNFSTLEDI